MSGTDRVRLFARRAVPVSKSGPRAKKGIVPKGVYDRHPQLFGGEPDLRSDLVEVVGVDNIRLKAGDDLLQSRGVEGVHSVEGVSAQLADKRSRLAADAVVDRIEPVPVYLHAADEVGAGAAV